MPKRAQIDRGPEGFPTNRIAPTTTVDEAQSIIEQVGGGDSPPVAGTVAPGEINGEVEKDPQTRQQQVKRALTDLAREIDGVAVSIYQMKLTVPQLQELAHKVITQVSDTVSEITIQRVKDIAPEILGSEA